MTRRRNPFRIVRITAATIGYIAIVGLFVWLFAGAIINAVEKDLHILWQFPLALLGFGVAYLLIAFACSAIARRWRKLEQHYDRAAKGEQK